MGAASRRVWAPVAVVSFWGCTSITEVQRADLAQVVERDGVAFTEAAIPEEIVARLSSHRLVIIGETHHLVEHAVFMEGLLQALHRNGFRQLLMEWPQSADWLLADFVNGAVLEPGWTPPTPLNGLLIERVRVFNSALPEDERISVSGIDANLADYGGANAFRDLIGTYVGHLGERGPVSDLLASAYGTADQQERALEALRDDLASRRDELSAAWGPAGYATVAEMVEVEMASVGIRANREDHYDLSVRLRESLLKRLTDLRLEAYPHRTLLNVGGSHAQKQRLKGTSQEWLGDYLVNHSTAVGGSVCVVAAVPARTVSAGAEARDFDLLDASSDNELFRLMHETWPGETVFLALDDPLFSAGGIVVNFEGDLYVSALKEQYDAVLLYPEAHQIPVTPGPGP